MGRNGQDPQPMTPRAIVSDIIHTHKAGKPLTEAAGICVGPPYPPIATSTRKKWTKTYPPADCFYDGDTFLEDLKKANKFELYVFVTFSILLVFGVGAFALVVGLLRKIGRFVTGK